MRKRLASSALTAVCLALLCACGSLLGGESGDPSQVVEENDNPSQYQVAFTVGDGSSSRSVTWAAKYQNVGFYYDSYYGHYYNIFCAADGTVGEIYTAKHIYVYLPSSAAGDYSSSDGVTAIKYCDSLGNSYSVDADYADTYFDIDISIDDKGFLHGSFSGMLVSPNAYIASPYVSISGTIFSYFE